jgi:hypothetical protein
MKAIYPSSVIATLSNRYVFAPGQPVQGGGKVLGALPVNPPVLPKFVLSPFLSGVMVVQAPNSASSIPLRMIDILTHGLLGSFH